MVHNLPRELWKAIYTTHGGVWQQSGRLTPRSAAGQGGGRRGCHFTTCKNEGAQRAKQFPFNPLHSALWVQILIKIFCSELQKFRLSCKITNFRTHFPFFCRQSLSTDSKQAELGLFNLLIFSLMHNTKGFPIKGTSNSSWPGRRPAIYILYILVRHSHHSIVLVQVANK